MDGRLVRARRRARIRDAASGRGRVLDRLDSPAPRHLVAIGAVVFFARRRARRRRRRPARPLRRRRPGDRERACADDRLEDAGYRETGVVVLIEDAPSRRRDGARAGRGDRATSSRPTPTSPRSPASLDTRSPDFVSRDGDATYLAVGLEPTDDDERAGRRPSGSPTRSTDEPGRHASAARRSPRQQVNEQVEEDLRTAELLAFPLLFLLSLLFFRSLVAALLPLLVGGLAIVGTFLMLRVASEFGSISIFALNLVTGLGLGLAIDYSLFIVSRYREEIARTGPGLEAMRRTMATAGRTVLFSLADGRRRARLAARLPAALPLLDGPRRLAGRADRRGDRADRPAGGPRPARRAGQLARAGVPPPARRARRAAGHEGFWYRLSQLVMRRPGPDRRRQRGAADRARDPVLLRSSSPRSTPRCCPSRPSARQVDDVLRAEFPPFRDTPITLAGRRRREPGRGDGSRASVDARRGRRRGPPAAELDDGVYAIEASRADPPLDRGEPGPGRATCATSTAEVAGHRLHRRTSSTSRTASSTTCRWCSRSSSSSPSSSSS